MAPRPKHLAPLRDFELVVMLAVLQLAEEAYPLQIRHVIEARTRRRVSRPAVFITLERLEDKGLLTSRYGDPTPVRGGRAKRYFRPKPLGVEAVRQTLATVNALTAGLESVLKPR